MRLAAILRRTLIWVRPEQLRGILLYPHVVLMRKHHTRIDKNSADVDSLKAKSEGTL
jgi:hypothetical protein